MTHLLCTCLLREGIQFALTGLDSSLTLDELDDMDPPPNIDFLMVLNEFSHRLLALDRTGEKGVVSFLDQQLPEGLMLSIKNKKTQGWDSLMFYHRHTSTAPVNKGRTTGGAIAVLRPGAISQSRAKKRSLKILNGICYHVACVINLITAPQKSFFASLHVYGAIVKASGKKTCISYNYFAKTELKVLYQ